MDDVIITAAVTGAETTREQVPTLPFTPEEIADETARSFEAGASIVHLHVREDDGTPTQDRDRFAKTIELIRAKCPILIETTTGGAAGMPDEDRLQPISLRPPMASLDCGSVNFGDEVLINTFGQMQFYARQMAKHDVKPTLECFDIGHIHNARMLIERGMLDPPHHFGLVLGVAGGIPATPRCLQAMVENLPDHSLWTVIAVGGKASALLHPLALALGGHVRVGFEDSIYVRKGVVAESNADLVRHVASLARKMGREVADVAAVQKALGIFVAPYARREPDAKPT